MRLRPLKQFLGSMFMSQEVANMSSTIFTTWFCKSQTSKSLCHSRLTWVDNVPMVPQDLLISIFCCAVLITYDHIIKQQGDVNFNYDLRCRLMVFVACGGRKCKDLSSYTITQTSDNELTRRAEIRLQGKLE